MHSLRLVVDLEHSRSKRSRGLGKSMYKAFCAIPELSELRRGRPDLTACQLLLKRYCHTLAIERGTHDSARVAGALARWVETSDIR